jgi:FeS assembly protein IscX
MKTRQVILHNGNPVEWVGYFFVKMDVLPDGPPTRRAATSWLVYLSCGYVLLLSSRWSEHMIPTMATSKPSLAYTWDGGFAMPREIDWTDTEEIGIQLQERFPEIEPYSVRFTDLHKYVTELPGFVGDPAKSNEGLLEAIQTAWNEEYDDAK